MSTDFRPERNIFARDLFDGRLAKFGVHKWITPQEDQTPTDGQINDLWVLGTSQDNQKITLTDGQGNYLGVFIDDDGEVVELTEYGFNNTDAILSAVAEAFETEIFSEHEPKYWGCETNEELDRYISLAASNKSMPPRSMTILPARFRQVALCASAALPTDAECIESGAHSLGVTVVEFNKKAVQS